MCEAADVEGSGPPRTRIVAPTEEAPPPPPHPFDDRATWQKETRDDRESTSEIGTGNHHYPRACVARSRRCNCAVSGSACRATTCRSFRWCQGRTQAGRHARCSSTRGFGCRRGRQSHTQWPWSLTRTSLRSCPRPFWHRTRTRACTDQRRHLHLR